MNDVPGIDVPIPVLRLALAQLDAELLAFGHHRRINLNMALSAEYYNFRYAPIHVHVKPSILLKLHVDRSVAWEPLLEPWIASVEVEQTIIGKEPVGKMPKASRNNQSDTIDKSER